MRVEQPSLYQKYFQPTEHIRYDGTATEVAVLAHTITEQTNIVKRILASLDVKVRTLSDFSRRHDGSILKRVKYDDNFTEFSCSGKKLEEVCAVLGNEGIPFRMDFLAPNTHTPWTRVILLNFYDPQGNRHVYHGFQGDNPLSMQEVREMLKHSHIHPFSPLPYHLALMLGSGLDLQIQNEHMVYGKRYKMQKLVKPELE